MFFFVSSSPLLEQITILTFFAQTASMTFYPIKMHLHQLFQLCTSNFITPFMTSWLTFFLDQVSPTQLEIDLYQDQIYLERGIIPHLFYNFFKREMIRLRPTHANEWEKKSCKNDKIQSSCCIHDYLFHMCGKWLQNKEYLLNWITTAGGL